MHKIKTPQEEKKAFAAAKQKRGDTDAQPRQSIWRNRAVLATAPGPSPSSQERTSLGSWGFRWTKPQIRGGQSAPATQSGATKCYNQCQPVSIPPAGDEDPNRAMNGQIGLAAHIPRANTEWTGRRIWVWLKRASDGCLPTQEEGTSPRANGSLPPLDSGRGAAGGDPARRAGGIDTPAVLWSAATRRELVKA